MATYAKKYGPWKRRFALTPTEMYSGESVWLKLYYARRVTNYFDSVEYTHGEYETVQRVATTMDMLRL